MKWIRLLPLAVSAILFAWAVSGCTTQEEFRAAAASVRFGVYQGDGDWSINKQAGRHGDASSSGVYWEWSPLAHYSYKLQAEANARALVEAAYARAVAPKDEECEPVECERPRPSKPWNRVR